MLPSWLRSYYCTHTTGTVHVEHRISRSNIVLLCDVYTVNQSYMIFLQRDDGLSNLRGGAVSPTMVHHHSAASASHHRSSLSAGITMTPINILNGNDDEDDYAESDVMLGNNVGAAANNNGGSSSASGASGKCSFTLRDETMWYQKHDGLITFNNGLGPLKTNSGGGLKGGGREGGGGWGIRVGGAYTHIIWGDRRVGVEVSVGVCGG